MKNFQDITVVITGAASGLGRSFALNLYQAGASLALCDLDLAGLQETLQLTGDHGERVKIHQVDVSIREEMASFSSEVLDAFGSVDMLINNAGISLTPQPFDKITEGYFKKVVDVNMWGVVHGVQAFLPHLQTRPEASIVIISSLAGLVGLYGYSAYSLSKSAIRGFAEALQCELAKSPISVLLVHPGGVKTNLLKNAPDLEDGQREEIHTNFTQFAFLYPDQVVKKIIRAVQKKRNRIIIGLDARFIYGIRKLFPRKFPSIIQAIFSQANFKEKISYRGGKK